MQQSRATFGYGIKAPTSRTQGQSNLRWVVRSIRRPVSFLSCLKSWEGQCGFHSPLSYISFCWLHAQRLGRNFRFWICCIVILVSTVCKCWMPKTEELKIRLQSNFCINIFSQPVDKLIPPIISLTQRWPVSPRNSIEASWTARQETSPWCARVW